MMSINEARARTTDIDGQGGLSDELVASYRQDGFVRVRGVLGADEVNRFRLATAAFLDLHRSESLAKDQVFTQLVNVWQQDETLKELTLHPRLARVATELAGFPLRIWHDQLLIKEPHNNAATEFHQDRPFWPHANDRLPLSVWIALVDVPPERGCMTFLPETQRTTGLRAQDPRVAEDLFELEPSLRWRPRVTIPLRAGDCTFHSGYTAHMALPNRTAEARLAHVTIYMDAETTYSGATHPVTDPLGLAAGSQFNDAWFPRV